jgi:hypothetical protein
MTPCFSFWWFWWCFNPKITFSTGIWWRNCTSPRGHKWNFAAWAKCRIAARIAEAEAEKKEAEAKKEASKQKTLHQKRLNEGWTGLHNKKTKIAVPTPPADKVESDCQCMICYWWFGTMNAVLPVEEFNWKQCKGCDQWVCPHCLEQLPKYLHVHEGFCQANNGGKLRGSQKRKRSVKM